MCSCNSSTDSSEIELETIKDSVERNIDFLFSRMKMLPSKKLGFNYSTKKKEWN